MAHDGAPLPVAPPVFLTDGIPATFIIAPAGRSSRPRSAPATGTGPDVVAFLEKTAATPPGTGGCRTGIRSPLSPPGWSRRAAELVGTQRRQSRCRALISR